MSNYLAIATVTATFETIVREAMQTVVPEADVKIMRPQADPKFIGAHLFLYRVVPNGFLRNDDLPTRDASGRLVQRPRYPADLEYLLSFYGGQDTEYVAQRLMGRVVTALNGEPVLSPQRIRATIASKEPALDGSDLDLAPEPLRLYPITLDQEQLARLWSVFYQVPYNLSLPYGITAVWLDSEATPQAAKPVNRLAGSVAPRMPVLTSIEPATFVAGENTVVRLIGSGFDTNAPAVLFDGFAVRATATTGALVAAPPSGAAGRVAVSAGSFARGATSGALQLVVVPFLGSPVAFTPGFTAPAPNGYTLPPAISAPAVIDIDPRRTYELVLNSTSSSASAVKPALVAWLNASFAAQLDMGAPASAELVAALLQAGVRIAAGDQVTVVSPAAAWRIHSAHQDVAIAAAGDVLAVAYGLADNGIASIGCAVDGIANGTYTVRLRVDGVATSRIQYDARGNPVSPLVTIGPPT
jgi:Pvc16 N-terminal domain/IPT/TIG domain